MSFYLFNTTDYWLLNCTSTVGSCQWKDTVFSFVYLQPTSCAFCQSAPTSPCVPRKSCTRRLVAYAIGVEVTAWTSLHGSREVGGPLPAGHSRPRSPSTFRLLLSLVILAISLNIWTGLVWRSAVQSSGVTRVGDTRGGNWGCHHSIISWKTWRPF